MRCVATRWVAAPVETLSQVSLGENWTVPGFGVQGFGGRCLSTQMVNWSGFRILGLGIWVQGLGIKGEAPPEGVGV